MARHRFEVEVPEGTHLSFSRKDDGGFSALLRDKNNDLVDHAVLYPIDDEDRGYDYSYTPPPEPPVEPLTEEELELLVQALAVAVGFVAVAVKEAAPHVKAW